MSENHLPAAAHIGYAHLQVADLERAFAFYADLLGLRVVSRNGSRVALSATGQAPNLIELTERPGARRKPRRTAGLYHVAIRLPSRAALARVVRHLVENHYPILGASDHLVSEALYLDDPDGNGLELYRDRPRNQWKMIDGSVAMSTDPLNVQALLDEGLADNVPWDGIDPATDIGHVHLHVPNLARAEEFYVNTLGFDVMQRSYPGALFVAAGGYHHHLGLNIWAGDNAPPPPDDAVGLLAFSVDIPGDGWNAVVERLHSKGIPTETRGNGSLLVRDTDTHAAVELVKV